MEFALSFYRTRCYEFRQRDIQCKHQLLTKNDHFCSLKLLTKKIHIEN